MIRNTFCHVPGIGEITERKLWASGIDSWDACLSRARNPLPGKRAESLLRVVRESEDHYRLKDARYFSDRLPSHISWRLFPDFRDELAYLDIETTGLSEWDHSITTISLYDGRSVFHYVQGRNLEAFEADVDRYKVLVTFNGKCFDIPFINGYFRTTLKHAHIDLRYVLKSLGISGGLKGCERQLGIGRGELEGVDGYFAVLLWNEYVQNGNPRALETLLAYNMEDTVNLERLMVTAYNLKLKGTPFEASHRLPSPSSPVIPFEPDRDTIDRIKRRMFRP